MLVLFYYTSKTKWRIGSVSQLNTLKHRMRPNLETLNSLGMARHKNTEDGEKDILLSPKTLWNHQIYHRY